MLGHTQPVFPRETPPPTVARSRTTTSAPRRESSQAHASPITPPPTTATFIAPMLKPRSPRGGVALWKPDYDCPMRASPPAALELGAADAVEGRPFAEAAETERDRRVMSAMVEFQRGLLREWPASKTGPVISDEVDHDGCKHFLAVPDAAAILAAR